MLLGVFSLLFNEAEKIFLGRGDYFSCINENAYTKTVYLSYTGSVKKITIKKTNGKFAVDSNVFFIYANEIQALENGKLLKRIGATYVIE